MTKQASVTTSDFRMLKCGVSLYETCCQKYSLKPNQHILHQVSRTDLMNLTTLDASLTFLGPIGVHAVLDFVNSHCCIQTVNLQKNGVDQGCVEHLCQILLDGHPSLSAVDLSQNLLSTGSTRRLWETIRSVPSILSVELSDCGIADEWLSRVHQALMTNQAARQRQLGAISPLIDPFTPTAGAGECASPWRLILVLTIGSVAQTTQFNDVVVPPLGSYLAGRRVCVSPVVLLPTDSKETADAKLKVCCQLSDSGHDVVWCSVFLDDTPLSDSQRHALSQVLQMGSQIRHDASFSISSAPSSVPPPPQHSLSCCKTTFVFSSRIEGTEERVLAPPQWLRQAGYTDEAELDSLLPLAGALCCSVLPCESVFNVQCLSDLFSSLSSVFPDQRHLPPPEEVNPVTMQEHDVRGVVGGMHDKVVKGVVSYIKNRTQDVTVPLVLYGAGGIGKRGVLSYVYAMLHRQAQVDKHKEGKESATRYLLYPIDRQPNSIVLFLYYVLSLFSPPESTSLQFHTVELLTTAVREAIAAYRGAPIVLMIAALDRLDTLGFSGSLATDWIPFSFPSTVKIVITVRHDFAALPSLRKRCPQPFDIFCRSLEGRKLVQLFKQELHSIGMMLPGLHVLTRSAGESLTEAEVAYLDKEDSSHMFFPGIAAIYVQKAVAAAADSSPITTEADVVALLSSMPSTVEALVQRLVAEASSPCATTVAIALTACALPFADAVSICEDTGLCDRHTAAIALMELIDMRLVEVRHARVRLVSTKVRDAMVHQYESDANTIDVHVEQHLLRQVITLSPSLTFSFRQLVPLMISTGNFAGLQSVLESSVTIDAVLTGRGNQMMVIDAFFRLLATYSVLASLAASDVPMSPSLDFPNLCKGLSEAQRFHTNFFQELLMRGDASPLSRDAVKNTHCANYPLAIPLNQGSEDTSVRSFRCDSECIAFHGSEDYICGASEESLMVFSVKSGNCVALRAFAFEEEEVTGVLMAPSSKVVVMKTSSVSLWDFTANNVFVFDGYHSTADPLRLSADGGLLLAEKKATGAVEVLDLNAKKVIATIAPFESPLFCHAIFSWDRILLRHNEMLHVLQTNGDEIASLLHDDAVSSVCSSHDGRLVTSVGTEMWVWAPNHQLMYRADAKDTITSLTVDESGSVLLVTTSGGAAQLWKMMSGTLIDTLATVDHAAVAEPFFTKDRTRIIGAAGPLLYVWESQTGQMIGAYRSPLGAFTHVQEFQGNVFASTVSSSLIRMWCPSKRVTSLRAALEGSITTDWTRNSKVCSQAIEAITVSPDGALLACVDHSGTVMMFNVEKGDRAAAELGSSSVTSLVFVTATMLAFTTQSLSVHLYDTASRQVTHMPLPSSTVGDCTLQLLGSTDGNFAVAASSPACQYLYVCEFETQPTEWVSLYHHRGPVLAACFFGSFLYTVGASDRMILLWHVPRRANRTGYQHSCMIISASCTASGVLIFVDEAHNVYHLTADNIMSPSRAALVTNTLVSLFPKMRALATTFSLKTVVCWGRFAFFTTSEGSVVMTSLHTDTVPNYIHTHHGTVCVAGGTSLALQGSSTEKLFLGSSVGGVERYQIEVPSELPDLSRFLSQ